MATYDVFEIQTVRMKRHKPRYKTLIINCRTQQRAVDFIYLKYGVCINEIISCRKIGEHDI